MAKKKEVVIDFDNAPEVEEVTEDTNINSENASNIDSDSNSDNANENNSGSANILSSVLSKSTKEPKKIYTGFYLEEPVVKVINKIVKSNKDTNKSKLVNDLLTEAFKQAGLL